MNQSQVQELTKEVDDHCRKLNHPTWTLSPELKEKYRSYRSAIKNVLSSSRYFEVKEQGSFAKDTAIPGHADFDFVLKVRNTEEATRLRTIRRSVLESLSGLEGCKFEYGNACILTFKYNNEITFDVVISYPGDYLKFDYQNLHDMVTEPGPQRDNLHSFARALKYWCKSLDLPIKSFVVEYIAKKLLRGNPNANFTDFLQFVISRKKIMKIPHLDPMAAPSKKDIIIIQGAVERAHGILRARR
jgi:hypothetical protein